MSFMPRNITHHRNQILEGFIMRRQPSPLEHLTAFSIVFVAGIVTAASFVTFMEQARRRAVRDHYRRLHAESKLCTSLSKDRGIEQ